LFGTGCAKTDSDSAGDGSSEVASFEEALTTVLVPSCGFDSCHGSGAGYLRVHERQTEADWLDMESRVISGKKLIDPGNPSQSYLIQKMEGASTIQGDVMPPSGSIEYDRIKVVRSWIENID